MSLNKCRSVAEETQKCPSNFRKDLYKMKIDNLKNPTFFVNDGTAFIKVESQIISRFRLNEETFTAFIEFTRVNCGVNFIKAFGAGQIDVQVMDIAGSEGFDLLSYESYDTIHYHRTVRFGPIISFA